MIDARKAKLLDKPGPWQDYRGRMLQMRARGFALRDAFADVLRGLNIREEIEDIRVEKEVIPPTENNQTLIEELEQQLQSENKVSVIEISEQIKAAKTQDELNKLTEKIKSGDYSEADKTALRKIFKRKKESFLQKVNNEKSHENV